MQLAGPIDGQQTITAKTRVREVKVPKWEQIHGVEFENWQHIVHTNLHSSAIVEDDAEAVINRIADVGVPDGELRTGMPIGQTKNQRNGKGRKNDSDTSSDDNETFFRRRMRTRSRSTN